MINYIEIMKKMSPTLIFMNFNYCYDLKTQVKKQVMAFFFPRKKISFVESKVVNFFFQVAISSHK